MVVLYVVFWQIPKDILLEVLGPSKVFMEVIKEIINSTVAEYVEKVFCHMLNIIFPNMVFKIPIQNMLITIIIGLLSW